MDFAVNEENYLINEYNIVREAIDNSREVILYGKTPVLSMIRIALKNLGWKGCTRIYDRGIMEPNTRLDSFEQSVFILCGLKNETRKSMCLEVEKKYPQSQSFSFIPIYFFWIKEVINRDVDYGLLAKTLYKVEKGECIANIDSIITTRCNLRCEDCSNGIPYRKNKRDVDLKDHIDDMKVISSIKEIGVCNIQGGEPFLDRRLPDWLYYHSVNPYIAIITIATNGSIVPYDDVMKAIRNSGAIIRISDYGDKLSNKKNELIKKAKDYDVPVNVYERAKTWVSCGNYIEHYRTDKINKEIASKCMFGTKCLMLYDRKLFCCCRTLYAEALGYDNDALRSNCINISKISNEMLEKVFNGDELYKMCDYCDFPMKDVEPATQIL